jgi:hypothetical protein
MPICPKCGSARVERFCAKCGAPAAIAPVWGGRMQRQPPPPPVPLARPRCGGGGAKFFVLFGLVFGVMFLFNVVRTSVVLPPKAIMVAPGVPSGRGPRTAVESPRLELCDQVDAKLLDGTRRVLELQDRATAIRNGQQEWEEQRGAVENLRQRLGQARMVAEEEGRWPVRAAGRTFGRADMDGAIDRTERYLERNRGITPVLSSMARFTSMAIRDADTQLDAMRRMQNEWRLGVEPRREREMGREFASAAERFDAIVNDPQLYVGLPEIPRFDLDAPQY